MANYCKNLWIKFNELQGAHQNCATILDSAKNEGKSQFTDLDSAISNTEAKLSDIQEQWENSFVEFRPGEKIFIGELESIKALAKENEKPQEHFLKHDLKLKVSNGVVVEISLKEMNITSAKYLGELHNLRELDLTGNLITDLSPLANLRNLQRINMKGVPCKDFSFFMQLKNLRDINLDGTPATNETTEILEHLNLESLSISQTNITRSDWLLSFPSLKYLEAANCNISDISALSEIDYIIDLILDGNPITDISPLAGLALNVLSLADTKIEDLGPLTTLAHISQLNIINNTQALDLEPLTRTAFSSGSIIYLSSNFRDLPESNPQKKYIEQLKQRKINVYYC